MGPLDFEEDEEYVKNKEEYNKKIIIDIEENGLKNTAYRCNNILLKARFKIAKDQSRRYYSDDTVVYNEHITKYSYGFIPYGYGEISLTVENIIIFTEHGMIKIPYSEIKRAEIEEGDGYCSNSVFGILGKPKKNELFISVENPDVFSSVFEKASGIKVVK
jgi:hypothetical protein